MAAQRIEIDIRGMSVWKVTKLLRDKGFSASSTRISMWDSFPGPATDVVWIEDNESHLLSVVVHNGMIVTLKPGENLHVADRPEGLFLLPGRDWFVAETLKDVGA